MTCFLFVYRLSFIACLFHQPLLYPPIFILYHFVWLTIPVSLFMCTFLFDYLPLYCPLPPSPITTIYIKLQKAAKKEEKIPLTAEQIREQQLAARADLRRKLEAEAANTKVNQMKIQQQWRKIMRLAKTEALKKDIEILSQNHERDVDRKDAILQMLDR